jgi:MFS family permease
MVKVLLGVLAGWMARRAPIIAAALERADGWSTIGAGDGATAALGSPTRTARKIGCRQAGPGKDATVTAAHRAGPRSAVTVFFVLAGLLTTSFFARLPAIQDRLGLSNGQIGLALLGLTVTLVIAQPLWGALTSRRGSARVVAACALLTSAAVVAPAFAGSFGTLVLSTMAIGAVGGGLDVSINVQGIAVERRLRQPILSGLHAAFSIGMLASALAAGVAAGAGLSPQAHLALVGVAGALTTGAFGPALLPGSADAVPGGPFFARPSRSLAAFGAIAFCVLLAEGAISDWSAIHLADTLAAPEATAVSGIAAFAATMTIGRLLGDAITKRLGTVAHVRGGALVAAIGIVIAASAPSVAIAVAGFALTGIGLSALFPLMVRAASERAGDATGPAIAAVSTTGYGGLVTGPPLIGFLAEATSLRFALGAALGLLCLTAAMLAAATRVTDRV